MFHEKSVSTLRFGIAILGAIVLTSANALAEGASPLVGGVISVSAEREPDIRLIAERDGHGVNIPTWDKKAKKWRTKNLRPTFFTQTVATEYASIAAKLSRDVRDCELSRFKGRLRDLLDSLGKKRATIQRKWEYADRRLWLMSLKKTKNAKRIQGFKNELEYLSQQAFDVDKIISILKIQSIRSRKSFKKGSPFKGCTKEGHRKTPAIHSVNLSHPPGPKTKVRRFIWVRADLVADWAGRDTDCTKGAKPKRSLCRSNTRGTVAVCWKGRRTGYPFAKCKTFSTWCTYKSVKVNTVPDAKAYGTVYECREPRKPPK